MPIVDSEELDAHDSPANDIYDLSNDGPLPYYVRRFSELLVAGTDKDFERAIEVLDSLPSIKAAYLIAVSVTHCERIVGIDDLGRLLFALDRKIKSRGNMRA